LVISSKWTVNTQFLTLLDYPIIYTMKIIKKVIEGNAGIYSQIFDFSIQILILISLIGFAVGTIPQISPGLKNALTITELITVIVFSLEYFLRLVVADHKIKFVFSFFGIIDLLAILPFYFAMGFDLRAIRILRILRFLRMFKLARYNAAMNRFYQALMLSKEEMVLFVVMIFILMFISSIGIYYFENPHQPEKFSSFFSSLWWAVATLTTGSFH